jgi:hypothetical protein
VLSLDGTLTSVECFEVVTPAVAKIATMEDGRQFCAKVHKGLYDGNPEQVESLMALN